MHHSTHPQCVLCKKAGILEQNYMSYSAEGCFGNHTNHKTIKDGLGGTMVSSAEAVKQHKNSEKNGRKS